MLCDYVCIYTHICVCTYTFIYWYIYIYVYSALFWFFRQAAGRKNKGEMVAWAYSCWTQDLLVSTSSTEQSGEEPRSLTASGFGMSRICLAVLHFFAPMHATGPFPATAIAAHTTGWFFRGLAWSNVGTHESRGQVTSLGLDVTWSCRTHRILGLKVQRTSDAAWEWHLGGALWLCHCICTYNLLYSLCLLSLFLTFAIFFVEVSLFLRLCLVPFSTFPCGLEICVVLGALLHGFALWSSRCPEAFFPSSFFQYMQRSKMS